VPSILLIIAHRWAISPSGCCVRRYAIYMVGRLQRVLTLSFAVMLLAPLLCAYDVALRNGTVIHFQKYRVVDNELLYLSESGEERSVLLTDINFARTRELNEKANPPLDLQSWIDKMNASRKAAAPPSPPLGDVARQLGLKGAVDAEGRVFTNDDFPSSPVPPAPESAATSASLNTSDPATQLANDPSASSGWAASKAKIELFLNKTENLTEQQYAARILGPDLDEVQFPRRAEWQAKLFAEHQKYVADAKLCISDRVSDEGRRQIAACSRLDSDKTTVQTARQWGKTSAQEWKSREDAFAPH
jgi:hypothetical protein